MSKYTEYRTQWQRDKRAKEAMVPDGKIQCLVCGLWYRKVGAHVWQVHKMTARRYREKFGFDVKRGQVPTEDREILRKNVFENGTVNNLKNGEIYRFKKGDKSLGKYKRSLQTMARLKRLI